MEHRHKFQNGKLSNIEHSEHIYRHTEIWLRSEKLYNQETKCFIVHQELYISIGLLPQLRKIHILVKRAIIIGQDLNIDLRTIT